MTAPYQSRHPVPTDEAELEEFVHQRLTEYYADGRPPWDTDVAPPELVDLIATTEPGRALDLGCGTGTNSVHLARDGWEVVGVDLVAAAIERARHKADAAAVPVHFAHGDVTRLDAVAAAGPFDLFFDLSCYCGIPTHRRDAYAAGLTRRAAAGARLLLFGYGPGVFDDGYTGVTASELRQRFVGWTLTDVTPGTNPFPTSWFTLRYPANG